MILPLDSAAAGAAGGQVGTASDAGLGRAGISEYAAADLDEQFRHVARVASAVTGGRPDAVTAAVPAGWNSQRLPVVGRQPG